MRISAVASSGQSHRAASNFRLNLCWFFPLSQRDGGRISTGNERHTWGLIWGYMDDAGAMDEPDLETKEFGGTRQLMWEKSKLTNQFWASGEPLTNAVEMWCFAFSQWVYSHTYQLPACTYMYASNGFNTCISAAPLTLPLHNPGSKPYIKSIASSGPIPNSSWATSASALFSTWGVKYARPPVSRILSAQPHCATFCHQQSLQFGYEMLWEGGSKRMEGAYRDGNSIVREIVSCSVSVDVMLHESIVGWEWFMALLQRSLSSRPHMFICRGDPGVCGRN